MGFQSLVEVSLNEEGLFFNLKGDREGVLIGKHGRTLDSLQFLFNRMVNKRLKENIKVFLDINGYKARRIDSLTKMALRLGEKVKREGQPLAIGPYTPHDRRIIHLALKNDPAIETVSLGDGEMKKIRILPKSKGL
ncbi:MAG: KH domain-containing protein [Desulfobacterota bacterium]|nr:KH domain-containing protein [Thermodesulfobacteriota bacterium]